MHIARAICPVCNEALEMSDANAEEAKRKVGNLRIIHRAKHAPQTQSMPESPVVLIDTFGGKSIEPSGGWGSS